MSNEQSISNSNKAAAPGTAGFAGIQGGRPILYDPQTVGQVVDPDVNRFRIGGYVGPDPSQVLLSRLEDVDDATPAKTATTATDAKTPQEEVPQAGGVDGSGRSAEQLARQARFMKLVQDGVINPTVEQPKRGTVTLPVVRPQ